MDDLAIGSSVLELTLGNLKEIIAMYKWTPSCSWNENVYIKLTCASVSGLPAFFKKPSSSAEIPFPVS